MNPFDRFLANALETVIRDELGQRTFKKIEKRVREKFNITMIDAVKNFHEVDAVLREDFGKGADKIEKQFLEKIIGQSRESKNSWITIHDQKLASLILESFGNPEKKRILEHSFRQPTPIMKVLESCNIPKTSGYRLTNELIKKGLLVETSFETTKEGKRVGNYTSLFNQIRIDIGHEILHVQVLMKFDFLKTSHIINAMRTIR